MKLIHCSGCGISHTVKKEAEGTWRQLFCSQECKDMSEKEMKFEAGKEYTTRDGSKARVYATDCPGRYPIHGAVRYNGELYLASWTQGGTRGFSTGGAPWDLMPPKLTATKYLFLYADGKVGVSDYPSLYRSGCEVVGTAVVELVEGDFGFELPFKEVKTWVSG